jgi:hypothetical protein
VNDEFVRDKVREVEAEILSEAASAIAQYDRQQAVWNQRASQLAAARAEPSAVGIFQGASGLLILAAIGLVVWSFFARGLPAPVQAWVAGALQGGFQAFITGILALGYGVTAVIAADWRWRTRERRSFGPRRALEEAEAQLGLVQSSVDQIVEERVAENVLQIVNAENPTFYQARLVVTEADGRRRPEGDDRAVTVRDRPGRAGDFDAAARREVMQMIETLRGAASASAVLAARVRARCCLHLRRGGPRSRAARP